MQKKEILIYSLTTTYVKSFQSGTARFVHDLNKELIPLGVRVKVITPHAKGEKLIEVVDGVKIIRFKYSTENFEINSLAISDEVSKSKKGLFKVFLMTCGFFLCSFFECLKEKPDIFHAHWAFPAGYVAYILSKIFRKKVLVTIHGGEIPLLKKFNFLRKVVINGLNNSSIVIANSNYTKKELMSMGVKEKKINVEKVTPNFLNHSENKKSLAEFRRKFAEPDHQLILFYGRLVERKGVEYLILALNEMEIKNVHLIIAGGGELFEKLRTLTKQLQLDSKITFFGRATDEELASLQDISDIFVCPSIVDSRGMTEYLGLVIPEAMDAGLPVIATSVGGIVDTVNNEVNGLLVEQKNPKAIANAIEKLVSDEDFKKKIIENSKETVKDFSPTIIAQSYFKIFQSLLKN